MFGSISESGCSTR